MDFIFMLTRDDQTVEDCLELVEEIAPLGLKHVGFKDVGVDVDRLRALDAAIKATGATVATWRSSRPRAKPSCDSVAVARDIGVDRLLGGTRWTRPWPCSAAADRLLSISRPSGGPSRRNSAVPVRGAKRMPPASWQQGCAGCDLLAYRATEADPDRAGSGRPARPWQRHA